MHLQLCIFQFAVSDSTADHFSTGGQTETAPQKILSVRPDKPKLGLLRSHEEVSEPKEVASLNILLIVWQAPVFHFDTSPLKEKASSNIPSIDVTLCVFHFDTSGFDSVAPSKANLSKFSL